MTKWGIFLVVVAMSQGFSSGVLGFAFRRSRTVLGFALRKSISVRSPVPKMVSTADVEERKQQRGALDQLSAAGTSAALLAATAAVNAAVSMRDLSAPEVGERSFVLRDGTQEDRRGLIDDVGLPLVYDKDLIQAYWAAQGGALTSRWTEFLGVSVPFLTRVITILISKGSGELKAQSASLAQDARERMETLGPTYIKLGQMMSVRPDVLPEEALKELKILQDSVRPFDTMTAIQQIESELGGPLSQFFSEISHEPVAAASLAQVYKAKLVSTGQEVAVKVQRPSVLETVSKDLYVLRRAAEVYQGLVDRFAPQQRTNYVALLNEWAIGFYTELDFKNEAANQQRVKTAMAECKIDGVYIPEVFHELSTRRVLVSEWIDGVNLSDCPPEEIKALIPAAQEAFLTQLLQTGVMHADPHSGNLRRLNTPRGNARLALLDFGLVARVRQQDQDIMVSAIIHLANRDYRSLVDDFINLEILPADCDRAKVEPLMDKALTPYVKGGGAQRYEQELKKIYKMDGTLSSTAGGFQAMTQDALTVLNDIPFSIPAYFALLGRAIVTLEGIALTGDPEYGIIMEAYPFISRKLLREDRPAIQKALQQVLYTAGGGGIDGMSGVRLSALLQSAMGDAVRESGAVIDLDHVSGELDLAKTVKLLMGESGKSLRTLLQSEAVTITELLLRQNLRKVFFGVVARLPRPPLIGSLLPKPESLRLPFMLPTAPLSSSTFSSFSSSSPLPLRGPVFATPTELIDQISPKLSMEEELYALSLVDASAQLLGNDARAFFSGDLVTDPQSVLRFALSFASTGKIGPGLLPGDVVSALTPFFQRVNSSLGCNASAGKDSGGIVAAIEALDDQETATLNAWVEDISTAVQQRVVSRLEGLK